MKGLILAHDLGTSGNKASLIDSDGAIVASKTVGYNTRYFNVNWAEQNPDDWWQAVIQSTKQIIKKADPAKIEAVCFSGQMMGCLCVDGRGKHLRPHILYSDQRADREENIIRNGIDSQDFYKISGHRISSSYSAAKLMWIKENEPDVYTRTDKVLNAKDYINFKLTGVIATDYSDASGTNLFNLEEKKWSDEILAVTGLHNAKLPDVVPSTYIIGRVTKEASKLTGLIQGTPVVAGGGDGVCAGVGAGSTCEGATYNYLGSSSWIATTTKEAIYDPDMRTFTWAHAVPGYYHPCGTMQTAGSSYAWTRDVLAGGECLLVDENGGNPYELMNEQVENIPPGSHGLLFLPYLLGERTPRWNSNARGAFVGLNISHTRGDLFRSVLEGISLNLEIILAIFRSQYTIDSMVLIGGGAKSKIWGQILADILNLKITIPRYVEAATSIGAAIIGGVGTGFFNDFSVAGNFLNIMSSFIPNPGNVKIYKGLKPIFENCYQSLTNTFDDLAGKQC